MPLEYSLSNSEVALLGLLSERAKHAWQIEKDVEHRDMRSWTDLSQSTIYRQLTSLAKAGLVDSAQEVVEGRARKVYSLTDRGRDALSDRLRDILGEPEFPKWAVDLATYNLGLVDPAEALVALRAYCAKLKDKIRCFKETEEYMSSSDCPAHRLAVVRRPVYLLESDLRWAQDFMHELEGAR